MPWPSVPVEERFWSKVDRRGPDECWEWTASYKYDTYGCFWANGKSHAAHRFSYEMAYGAIVADGLCVMHSCDNPPCVNPAHLSLGTHAENIADRDKKGRAAVGERSGSRLHPELFRGEGNGRAILTEAQALDIRARYVKGRGRMAPGNARELAVEYGVSMAVIQKAASGKTWPHLPMVRTR